MNLPGARIGIWAAGVPLILLLASGAAAQTPKNGKMADADSAIEDLRRVAKELSDSVKRFHTDIDEVVTRYDRGYRASDEKQFQGADSGLTGGPADIVQETVRKFAAFRMLAAHNEQYDPPPVEDMKRIQNLIAEAHRLIDASSGALRGLLIVSVNDIERHSDGELKIRHDQLLKARALAEEASKQAWLALPVDLPDADSAEVSSQKAWDILTRGWPNGTRGGGTTPVPQSRLDGPAPVFPIRIDRRKRFTLVSEFSYRMALTDAGINDADGRRLFYQEEWIQRGASVIRIRWRVALDMATGEHILVKRYPTLELRGTLDDLYTAMDRYSLWYLEAPDGENRPSTAEVESALADVEDARVAIRAAIGDFQGTSRTWLARQDQDRNAAGMPLLDAGLADPIRESLFAIRAHLAGVPASVEAENRVWQSITEAGRSIARLESLAAWANRMPEEEQWGQLLDRADRAIDLVRGAELEAAAELPPNSTQAEARFPALQRGVIIRIRRPTTQNLEKGMILCRQEIWHMESPMPGSREVRRTATLVAVDPRTGAQTAIGGKTKYYPAVAGDLLEQIFDQYSADDLPLARLN